MKSDNITGSESVSLSPNNSPAANSNPATSPPGAAAPFQMPRNPRRPGPVKRRVFFLSALIVIGMPTIFSIFYYIFIASDQFVARGHFVVRHRSENTAALSSLSLLGLGSAGTSSLPDTMVLNDYLTSIQIIKDLSQRIDLRKCYDTQRADFLARLNPAFGEKEISDERLLEYWKKIALVHFDTTTGLSVFEVRAFSPEEAKNIADNVFRLGEELVNRLTLRAQEDALSLARKEVLEYRQRAISALDAMQAFQEKARQVDPEAFAQVRVKIEAGVEEGVSQLQTQLDMLRAKLPEDAPGIIQLKDRLFVIEKQLVAEREKSTESRNGESATRILNEFAKLRLECEFATKAYLSSLASLESARISAMRQNLYLETFVRPQLAQTNEYPRVVPSVLFVFFVSFLVWAIGGLFVSAAREHL